jgi:copper chaperone CopZ
MKNIFFIALVHVLLAASNSFAQIKKAEILATGLTCSMCSNAIYKKLSTISGVDTVLTDLNTNIFTVYLHPDNKYAPNIFKENIEKAGFFIGSLKVTMPASAIKDRTDQFIPIGKFEPGEDSELSIKIFDEGYITQKEYKKWSKTLASIESYAAKKPNKYHFKLEGK